jgi:hypothetical protein
MKIETHEVKYEGLEITVTGTVDDSDETTGYKGGFSYIGIYVNEQDISWMLRHEIIEQITDLVVEENY